MDLILRNFMGNLVAFIIIFILILTIFGIAVAGKKYFKIWYGFFKNISIIFYVPFVNLFKILNNLVKYSDNNKKESANMPHYIARKFVSFLEVIFIIVTISFISRTFIDSYKAFLPPEYLLSAEKEIIQQIDEYKGSIETLTENVDAANSKWNSGKNELIKKYKEEALNPLLDEYKKELTQVSEQTGNVHTVFLTIKDLLHSNEKINDNDALYEFRRKIFDDLYYSNLGYYEKESIANYVNRWYSYYYKKNYLNNVSEDEFRSEIQPDVKNWTASISQNQRSVEYLSERLKAVREEMKYDFEGFIITFLKGFAYLLIYMWSFGLLIDFISIGLKLSENVFITKELLLEKKKEEKDV